MMAPPILGIVLIALALQRLLRRDIEWQGQPPPLVRTEKRNHR